MRGALVVALAALSWALLPLILVAAAIVGFGFFLVYGPAKTPTNPSA